MGADCCGHGTTFEGLSADYKRRLWIVINASTFLVEMGAGALLRLWLPLDMRTDALHC